MTWFEISCNVRMGSNGKSIAQQGDWVDNKSSPWHLDARVNTQQHYGPLLNPLAARMVASTMRCLELVVWDMWRWNGWMTWISKAEWQHKRIASWMNIKTSIIIRSLYRTKVSRMSITKHWPTTICWWYHMTMLNACAEAHAFATLMLWKCS